MLASLNYVMAVLSVFPMTHEKTEAFFARTAQLYRAISTCIAHDATYTSFSHFCEGVINSHVPQLAKLYICLWKTQDLDAARSIHVLSHDSLSWLVVPEE